jgi:hypothetical protein
VEGGTAKQGNQCRLRQRHADGNLPFQRTWAITFWVLILDGIRVTGQFLDQVVRPSRYFGEFSRTSFVRLDIIRLYTSNLINSVRFTQAFHGKCFTAGHSIHHYLLPD